jgi:hypothetical protein
MNKLYEALQEFMKNITAHLEYQNDRIDQLEKAVYGNYTIEELENLKGGINE